MSATATAAAVRARDLSPQDLWQRSERADRESRHLNAIVARAPFASPAQLDGELAGVPFVVSDGIAVDGLPHTSGLYARREDVASGDATVVARLRSAGAVPFGLGNVSEAGFWIEADNPVHGRTLHPHDRHRTPGGSAGGVAAAVAAGVVPFGLGIDDNGGVRIPAAFCGVYGHSPSASVVPLTGCFPMPVGRRRTYVSAGVIARSAVDLMPVLRAVAGEDGVDRSIVSAQWASPAAVDFRWRRVVMLPDLGIPGHWPSGKVRAAVRRVADILDAQGAYVETWAARELAKAGDIWLSMVHEGYGLQDGFVRHLEPSGRVSIAGSLIRRALGGKHHTGSTLGMVALERLTSTSYARIQRFAAEGRRLGDRLARLLADGAVLLVPTYPSVAPKHRRSLLRPANFLYSALFNVLRLPSTTIPVALGKHRLPVGIQAIAADQHDHITIATALTVERVLARGG